MRIRTRYRIEIEGIVQGVGFRPFVYRLAEEIGLTGWVTNTSDGVLIEVEGPGEGVEMFTGRLEREAPPLSAITSVAGRHLPPAGYRDFTIRGSIARPDRKVLVSPDTAICPDCRRELLDPDDRRHGYPFINCTNCGPRYTIINSIPYDRPNTSMARFTMCPRCRAEYDDPADRRFHAQPNACEECGPRLQFRPVDGSSRSGDPLRLTVKAIRQGRIAAIKGLGGFHLAVDPFNGGAVRRLRSLKGREEKPFAVMVRDMETAGKLCVLKEGSEDLLTSTESPIVLLNKRPDPGLAIAAEVAPKSRYFGLMLPYTPLHTVLMEEFDALVMTSANIAEEPLSADNEEAQRRLSGIADIYLMHDREIVLRCDDSIVMPNRDDPAKGPVVLRRARGFVPAPVPLPMSGDPVLALGPELKGTVCLTRGNQAFIGQHLGDLKNMETLLFLREVVTHLMDILQVSPRAVACDMHPDYLTSRLVEEGEKNPWGEDLPVYRVQHHQAHILSCMAENGVDGPALGLALDGTGYGTDGTIWGGEILWVDGTRMRRLGHLRTVWMPGGDQAIREPYRMALSCLVECRGPKEAIKLAPVLFPGILENDLEVLAGFVERRTHGIMTSSCGRLFDAFSAMLGVCLRSRYEGQAAIELEMLTDTSVKDTLPFSVGFDQDGMATIDMLPAFDAALDLRLDREPVERVGGMFHRTLAVALAQALSSCGEALTAPERGSGVLPMAGGVFQNVVFSEMIRQELSRRSQKPILHRTVPTNDGGISLGQAVFAIRALQEGV
ncbi:MAG: carbamoyltransferase HypF [Deltaproteobacteria bacterium]|nr:carbamoyltransferase HypF [Deltaproteobacteria bacterium]